MKVLLVTLLFVAGAFARNAGIQAEGPACPLDDPMTSPPAPLNITLEPIIVVNEGSARGELVTVGLSTLKYTYDVNLITLAANFEVSIDKIEITSGEYNAEGWIDLTPFRPETIPSGPFVGSGPSATFTGTNLNVQARAALFINVIGNKVSIRELTVESLTFDSFASNLGDNFLVDGTAVNWDELNANFKQNFDADWAAYKAEIVEKARLAVNKIVGQYTLEELLELIGNIGGGGGEGCTTARSIKINL